MIRTLNFWLAVLIACAFIAITVFCSAHGVRCWSALGFALFFLFVAYFSLNTGPHTD